MDSFPNIVLNDDLITGNQIQPRVLSFRKFEYEDVHGPS